MSTHFDIKVTDKGVFVPSEIYRDFGEVEVIQLEELIRHKPSPAELQEEISRHIPPGMKLSDEIIAMREE